MLPIGQFDTEIASNVILYCTVMYYLYYTVVRFLLQRTCNVDVAESRVPTSLNDSLPSNHELPHRVSPRDLKIAQARRPPAKHPMQWLHFVLGLCIHKFFGVSSRRAGSTLLLHADTR